LQRLVRLAAEHPGVHGFVHHATADNGVVEQARALTRELLQGRDISQQCRELCRRHGVPEPLLRARLWAVASLFPGYSAADVGPYEILGVDPTADPETIKSAFRKLCRESHPDLNPNDPEAATRFQKIKSAYDMVSEPAGGSLLSRPSGACVWEESPAEESRPTAWGRMRHLAPLAMVVAVLILTVGVADLFVRRPRTSSLPRDASVKTQTANTPDEAELGHKEPLTLGTARNRSAEIVAVEVPEPPRPDTSEASRPEADFANATTSALSLASAPLETGHIRATEEGEDSRQRSEGLNSSTGPKPVSRPGMPSGAPPLMPKSSAGAERARDVVGVRHENPAPDSPPAADGAPAGGGGVAASRPASQHASSGRRPAASGANPAFTTAETEAVRGNASCAGQELQAKLSAPPWAAGDAPVESSAARSYPAGSQVVGAPAMEDIANVEARLKRFLDAYSGDYSKRDLKAFMAHFTPQAVENTTPVKNLLSAYEENFRVIPTMRYSIEAERWVLHDEGIQLEGRFSIVGACDDGRTISSKGRLCMELVPFEGTYRVRSLQYSFQ
jgi:DnaJ-domain-containing protein 1